MFDFVPEPSHGKARKADSCSVGDCRTVRSAVCTDCGGAFCERHVSMFSRRVRDWRGRLLRTDVVTLCGMCVALALGHENDSRRSN